MGFAGAAKPGHDCEGGKGSCRQSTLVDSLGKRVKGAIDVFIAGSKVGDKFAYRQKRGWGSSVGEAYSTAKRLIR